MDGDRFGAFLHDSDYRRAGRAGGALSGLGFAAKDVFDLEGRVTGAGQPGWRAAHAPAAADAPAVRAALDAGARLVGRTICDELCYSLNGTNRHDGDPVNPRAPDRLPGGSSCGSAVATAAGEADFSLGTDCAGSIRVPAAFCGIYGIRPSFGRLPVAGVYALAPSFDVAGWFAADARVFARAGRTLIADWRAAPPVRRVVVAEDAFDAVPPQVADAARPLAGEVARALGCPPPAPVVLAPHGLDAWGAAFRTVQGAEIRDRLVPWVDAHKPDLDPAIADRLAWAARVGAAEASEMRGLRAEAARRVAETLDRGTILCLPTAVLPPRRDSGPQELEAFRAAALRLTAPAGLAGAPQVHLPLAVVDGLPSGISIMAGRGRDETLIEIATLPALAPPRMPAGHA